MPTRPEPPFDAPAKKRIANVVRTVEAQARNNGNVKRPYDAGGGGGGLPTPQYEGELLQSVADGTWGASYLHGYNMNPTA